MEHYYSPVMNNFHYQQQQLLLQQQQQHQLFQLQQQQQQIRAPGETLANLVGWCGERYGRNGSLGIASSFIPTIQRPHQQEQQVFSPKSFLSHRHLASYPGPQQQSQQQQQPQPPKEEVTVDCSNTNLLLLDQFLKRAEESQSHFNVETTITTHAVPSSNNNNNQNEEEEEVEYIIEETCTIEEDFAPYFNPDSLLFSAASSQTSGTEAPAPESELRTSYEGPGETNKKRKRADEKEMTPGGGQSNKRAAKGGPEDMDELFSLVDDCLPNKPLDEHFPPLTKASFSRSSRSRRSFSSFCQITTSTNDPMENYIAQLLNLDTAPLDGSAFETEWYSTAAF